MLGSLTMFASASILLLRSGLAVVFLYAGADKLWHWQESLNEVAALGLPVPRLFVTLTVVTQIVGAGMVVTGIFAGLGAMVTGLFHHSCDRARTSLLAAARPARTARTHDRSGTRLYCLWPAPPRGRPSRPMNGATLAASDGGMVQVTLPPPLDQRAARWLLLGLGFATGMEFYTFDSVNLVLPDFAGSLGLSDDEASWLLTTYSSSLFLGAPVSIWFASHVGYKHFLIGSVLMFAAASVGCALAPDLPMMLFWRAVQGFAGAGLVVWWRASIYLLCAKAQRSQSLMRVSTMLYLSCALALLASGPVTELLNWRLIFLPNLIYAAFAVALIGHYFPSLPPPPVGRLTATDWPGIGLIALSLICLQIVLSRGQIDDWFGSPFIRNLAFASALSLALFVIWQSSARNPAPLLRLDLLRDRNVVASALIGVFTGIILSGSLYMLPEYLREVATLQLSAKQTGQVMCVYALTAAAIRPFMVKAIARVGQRKAICLALVFLFLSMRLFSHMLTADTPRYVYFLPLVLYAFCLAPLLPAVGSGTVAQSSKTNCWTVYRST